MAKRSANERSSPVVAESSKRPRLDSTQPVSDSGASQTPVSPGPTASHGKNGKRASKSQQPTLTAEERKKLMAWLDRMADKDDGSMFPIVYTNGTNSKRNKNGKLPTKRAAEEELILSGQPVGTVSYTVKNKAQWDQLTKYRRCTVSEQTFVVGDCVLVRSDEEEDDTVNDPSLSQWKAQIHEVRALDENHVYLRVTWIYRPAHDIEGGRKPYHGFNELIPSTEMCIIDAKTINSPLKIKHWDEYNENETHGPTDYFWRQTFDFRTKQLSACRLICSCQEPQNPDKRMIQCEQCSAWQHSECLVEDALDRYLHMTDHPNGPADAADGINPALLEKNASSPSSQHKTKEQANSKKHRTSSSQDDWERKAEKDGVKATLDVHPKSGQVTINVLDPRRSEPVVLDGLKCLLCEESLEK